MTQNTAAAELIADCRYCDQRHGARFLCDPAARVLEALYAQGQRFDQPVVEFPEPLNGADVFGPDTVLLAQFLVKAAVTDVAGVQRPVLIFTGIDSDGRQLPHWLYPGDAAGIRRAITLVSDLGEMAIRRAAEASSS